MVSKHLEKNKKLYVAFVDFRKDFDTVKRNILWNVLLQLDIGGNMFNTLGAMYSSVYLVSDVTQEKLTALIVYKD